jgi:hypothetical protein
MIWGVFALLKVAYTVEIVISTMNKVPQRPTKDDPVSPALKLGLAPKRSNFCMISHTRSKIELSIGIFFLTS